MSLLRRIWPTIPRPGEQVEIHQHNRLLAAGTVVAADAKTVTIASRKGLIDLDTNALRRGIHDGSIVVRRMGEG